MICELPWKLRNIEFCKYKGMPLPLNSAEILAGIHISNADFGHFAIILHLLWSQSQLRTCSSGNYTWVKPKGYELDSPACEVLIFVLRQIVSKSKHSLNSSVSNPSWNPYLFPCMEIEIESVPIL